MAVSADWRGKEPFGAFGIEYTVTLDPDDGWKRFDIRDAPFWGRADVLWLLNNHPRAYVGTDLESRGVLRQIDVSVVEGSEPAKISMSVTGGSPLPSTSFQTAKLDGPGVRIVSSTRPERHEWWMSVDSGQTTVNLSVRFDIPDAA